MAVVAFTNPAEGIVYLPACGRPHPPHVTGTDINGNPQSFGAIVPACLGPPVSIGPGETFEYFFDDFLYAAIREEQASESTFEGTYRMVWLMYQAWDEHLVPHFADPLPQEAGQSAPFRIVDCTGVHGEGWRGGCLLVP